VSIKLRAERDRPGLRSAALLTSTAQISPAAMTKSTSAPGNVPIVQAGGQRKSFYQLGKYPVFKEFSFIASQRKIFGHIAYQNISNSIAKVMGV